MGTPNELSELESRGIRFVRYADDMLLFAKTKRSAERMLEHILPFIEKKMLLKVNKEKTTVAYSASKSSGTALANLTHRFPHLLQDKKNRHSRYIHTNYADIIPG